MIIFIYFLYPILCSQKIDHSQSISLPLFNEYTIDTIRDQGLIYKYYLSEDNDQFTQQTFCQVNPAFLKLEIQDEITLTEQTEQQFQIDYYNGTYTGKISFIKQTILTNYGLIALTTDKTLTFIAHNSSSRYQDQRQGLQIIEVDSVENSHLLYIAESNQLLLLIENTVLEYEIITHPKSNYAVEFVKTYWQHQIQISQIKSERIFGSKIFILTIDGTLSIYNSFLQKIYQFQENIIYFEFSLDTTQPIIIFIDYNFEIQSYSIIFQEKIILQKNSSYDSLEKAKNATMFTLYANGFLIVTEQENHASILVDYLWEENKWTRIHTHYIQYQIRNIVSYQSFAILICDQTQKIITIGIKDKYLNQQNYRLKPFHPTSGLQNIIIYQSVNTTKLISHIYGVTRSKVIKLNMKIVEFHLTCSCQNTTEAKNSPYKVELTYFSSSCQGCQKIKKYQIYFNFPILTKENTRFVLIGLILGITLFIALIGAILNKYITYKKCISQTNGAIVLETIYSQPHEAATDNKLGFESVIIDKSNQKHESDQ